MKYLYEPVYITVGVSEDVKCFRYEQTSAEESVLLTTRSSDFTTTEMTTTNDVITEIPTLQTDDTERITLIGDNTFISTQESSAMIETTSPTLRNTNMDDNTFLSTTKSGPRNLIISTSLVCCSVIVFIVDWSLRNENVEDLEDDLPTGEIVVEYVVLDTVISSTVPSTIGNVVLFLVPDFVVLRNVLQYNTKHRCLFYLNFFSLFDS
jgi:hypothetical protein